MILLQEELTLEEISLRKRNGTRQQVSKKQPQELQNNIKFLQAT